MPRAVHDVDTSAGDTADVLDVVLARAQRGDEDAFRTLWTAIQPRLLRYLRVRTTDGADDIAGETWLQVVRDLGGFRGGAADFRAWVFTIARNRAIDAARARKARPVELHAEVPDPARRPVASAEADALERLSTADALQLVRRLPAEQAELVALRVIAGLDVGVVAGIVGKSPGAVRVSVHRGLRALAAMTAATAGDRMTAEVI